MEGQEFEKAELDALQRVVSDATAEPMTLTLPLLKHITNDFSTEIGTGGFATVYLGTLPNGSRIAVRRLSQSYSMDARAFYHEVKITREAAHKNIVRLIGLCDHTEEKLVEYKGKQVCAEFSEMLLCTEYVTNGTLDKHITDKFHGGLEWNHRYQILKGICRGMRHLHDEVHIVHGDIKPENILLEDNLMPKIFDFGLARRFTEEESLGCVETIMGTIGYMAPEVIHYGRWSVKSEIYSFGVTIMKLLVGWKYNWEEKSVEQVLNQLMKRLVKEGAFSSWENKYQQVRTCLEIGYKCVDTDPDKRPTALKIIQMLDETESTDYTLSGGHAAHAPPLWQQGDEESDLSDSNTIEIEPTPETESESRDEESDFWGTYTLELEPESESELEPDADSQLETESESEFETCVYTSLELEEAEFTSFSSYTTEPLEAEFVAELEPEPAKFVPSDEELVDLDTNGEISTEKPDKPDIVSKLPTSTNLSDIKVLEKITNDFSHDRIVGKDGTFKGSHKAFVYKGDIQHRTMVAVKRLIGVEIPAEKFKRQAEQLMTLDHKNIAKVAGYCHDESRGQRLVQFKGKPRPQVFNGAEQLLCYEYMHKGSLREYLIGRGCHEIEWHMRFKLIKGTCEGLHYLHTGRGDCRIVHLNLNPSNVLLDENNTPRITGFDFSKLIGEKNTKSVVVSINGPIAYLPPDFFHSKGTDLKYLATVDIYSLGLMILEITIGQEIKGDHGRLIKSVEENWREESQLASLYTSLEPDMLSQVKLCIDIALDCLKSKPEKRPTADEIIIWLEKRSKPVRARVPVPRPRVPRAPARANITNADDGIQEKEKRVGFMKWFGGK